MTLYCVVYRMGGPARFKWQRALPTDKDTATEQVANLVKAGYTALRMIYSQSLSLGMPETFDASGRPEDVRPLKDGWSAMEPARLPAGVSYFTVTDLEDLEF